MLKWWLRILVLALILVAFMAATTTAGDLISSESTIDLLLGLALFITAIFLCGWSAIQIIKGGVQHEKDGSGGSGNSGNSQS